jgi:hypothetical protein
VKKKIKSLQMPGPGALRHAPENNVVAWTGSELSPSRDTFGLFDKRTLEQKAEIKPAPGRTLANITFTRDGHYALAHLSEAKNEGTTIIVFDAATFKEIKRIQLEKSVDK